LSTRFPLEPRQTTPRFRPPQFPNKPVTKDLQKSELVKDGLLTFKNVQNGHGYAQNSVQKRRESPPIVATSRQRTPLLFSQHANCTNREGRFTLASLTWTPSVSPPHRNSPPGFKRADRDVPRRGENQYPPAVWSNTCFPARSRAPKYAPQPWGSARSVRLRQSTEALSPPEPP
jgi:hypothetical protein